LIAVALPGKERPVRDRAGRPVVVYAHPPCPPELMAIYNPIFDEFRRTHPDIDFRVLHITGNYEDKIKVMFAGNVAPDVIFMYPTALPAWVDLGGLEPLDDYLARSGKTRREDYFPVMLDTFSCKGKLYGLPKDASAPVMYYNVEMFEKCGVPKPRPDWTWSDMLQAAQALTRDTDGDGRVDQWGLYAYPWYMFVWQNGGRILDESGRHCALREPKALEALQFWADLRVRHSVTPTPEADSDMGDCRMFALRKVAMIFEMYPAVSILRKQCDFKWDIAPMPGGPAGRAVEVQASAMAVTSDSLNKEAAFEFVRWITSPAGMRFLVSVESPSCVELARSDAFLLSPGLPESKKTAIEAMDYARPPLQHPRYFEIMDALGAELGKVWLGMSPLPDAVERAAAKADEVLQRTW
jgi:multiple sugar transport system substrate-binding protein